MVAIDVIARDKASKTFDQVAKSARQASGKISGIQKAGQRASKAGKSMTKGVTLPIFAMAAGAVKSADSVGDAMDSIKVATGASGDQLAGLQGVAKGIAKKVPADIKTVSTAVGALNTQTGASGPVLNSLTTQVLEASRVLGEDGAANADAFGRALNQANIPAKDGGKVLNTLFAASQKYGTSLSGMMGNLQKFGPQMQSAGLSMDDTIDLFGQFNKAGVSANRIVPSLNAAFLKWSKAGKDPAKMLGKLSDQISGASSQQEAMTAASQYFSGPGASAFVTAIRNGGVSLDNLGDSLDASSVDIIKTGKSTRTMGERLKVLKNKAVLSLVPIGQKILPKVIKVFSKLGDIITKATKWWDGLSGTTKKFIAIAVGVVAAIGPALSIFGKLISIGIKVKRMIVATRAAMVGFNAVMAANPLLIVVAAVAALVAIFVVLWNKSEAFRDFWKAVWAGIKSAVSAVVDWFTGTFVPVLSGIWDIVKKPLQAYWDYVKIVFDTIKNIAKGFIEFFQGVFTGDWSKAWDGIKKIFSGFFDGIKAIGKLILSWFGDLPGKIWAKFKAVTATILGWGKKVMTWVWNGLKAVFSKVLGWFVDMPGKIWSKIKSAASTILGWGKKMIGWIVSGFKAAAHFIWEWYFKLPVKIWDQITRKDSWLQTKAQSIITWIRDGIKSVASKIWDWFGKLPGKVWDKIKAAMSTFTDFGKRMINWIKQGLLLTWHKVTDWFGGLGGRVVGAIKGAGSMLWSVGKKIMQGLKDGLLAGWHKVTGWLSGLNPANWKGPESRDKKMLVGAGLAIMQGLGDGMATGWGKNARWLSSLDPSSHLSSSRFGGSLAPYRLPSVAPSLARPASAERSAAPIHIGTIQINPGDIEQLRQVEDMFDLIQSRARAGAV